jgi:hypothetical protein
LLTVASALAISATALAQQPPNGAPPAPPGAPPGDQKKPDFPPFEHVSKDYEQVVSTADGSKSLYTIWINKKENQLLAELNPQFEGQRIFIATSIAGGSTQTGWQWNDLYCYWTRHDDKLVLMEPNLQRQARGGAQDEELRSAVKRTYSDRVVHSVKILAFGPNRGPVVDLDDLLINNSQLFTGLRGNGSLAKFGHVKAFPENIEVPVTIPMPSGELTTLHYSVSVIPKTDYKPRESDERIGYFLTVFKDFTKNEVGGNQFIRYINRWNLQKRDPSLTLSPPVKPIVFYVEHTVPVRYRRYVRDGILDWNKAFEKCGFIDAVEVRQQDAKTGAFMDVDPEDVRYNFFRWISSERAFAMGPSRVNPETGEILDADIIFDDSMLKHYALEYQQLIAAYGLDGVDPEAMEWIQQRPSWNPLARFNPPNPVRDAILKNPELTDDQKADLLGLPRQLPSDGLHTRVVQQNSHCDYGMGMAMQMRTAHLAMRLMSEAFYGEDKPGEEPGDDVPKIDGVPEEFLGLILKEIVMHEVGHTLGLRHNFKASSWLTIDEYTGRKGEANVGSVMDYNPIFVPADPKAARGDWVTPTIGPYDFWAIEYGYTLDDKKREEIVKQVAKRELQYATDEDTMGPDPLVNRFDMSAEPLDWASSRLAVVKAMREKLLDKAVTDGQEWYLLRQAYEQLLGEQLGALRIASRYVGGVYIHRDRKGDPDSRDPLIPVEADKQRKALKMVIDNSFFDESFDLRTDVLRKLATDKHRHWGSFGGGGDEAFSIHDRVAQIQSFALMYLLNPGALKRVYDNELRTPVDQDTVTLPEVMNSVVNAAYTELDTKLDGATFTNRQPMISSLRRNLQSEATDRLIDLSISAGSMPQPIQTLALQHLRNINAKLDTLLEKKGSGQLDDYTVAHLGDLNERIDRALETVNVTGNLQQTVQLDLGALFGQPASKPAPVPQE